jgi:hypothetical protein
MSDNGWPDGAREAVARAIAGAGLRTMIGGHYVSRADAALAALAPFVAAREAAAFKRGAEAMREACAQFHETRVAASLPRPDAPLSEAKIRGYVHPAWHRTSAQLIAVLPIPEDRRP